MNSHKQTEFGLNTCRFTFCTPGYHVPHDQPIGSWRLKLIRWSTRSYEVVRQTGLRLTERLDAVIIRCCESVSCPIHCEFEEQSSLLTLSSGVTPSRTAETAVINGVRPGEWSGECAPYDTAHHTQIELQPPVGPFSFWSAPFPFSPCRLAQVLGSAMRVCRRLGTCPPLTYTSLT